FYTDFNDKYGRQYDKIVCAYIVLFTICFFGFRGFDIGRDTPGYLRAFRNVQAQPDLESAMNSYILARDPYFNAALYYISKIANERFFIVITAALFILPIQAAVKRITTINRSVLLFGFVCLMNFTSLGTNVIRQGISLSF